MIDAWTTRAYRLCPYRDSGNIVREYWDHPVFTVLAMCFFARGRIPGRRQTGLVEQHTLAICFMRWYIERYYHSFTGSWQLDLSCAVSGILRNFLVDAVRYNHNFFYQQSFIQSNLFGLGSILMYHNIAFVSRMGSAISDQSVFDSQSARFLQSTADIVIFIHVTNKIRAWSIEHCQTCRAEVENTINSSPEPPSFCCMRVCIMQALQTLRRRVSFVRLTAEETQLLRERLSNAGGGLPEHHKTTPHSEKVRHILLKSFLWFAPEVPGTCFSLLRKYRDEH